MSDKHAKLTLTQFKKISNLPDVFIHTQLIIALPFLSTGADQPLKSDLIHNTAGITIYRDSLYGNLY